MPRPKLPRKLDLNLLRESLMQGQDLPILESESGFTIDGLKRKTAMGLDQPLTTERKNLTKEEALLEWIRHCSQPWTREHIKDRYDELKKYYSDLTQEEIIELLMLVTQKSRKTIYRAIGLMCQNGTKTLKPKWECANCGHGKSQVLAVRRKCLKCGETIDYNI